MPSARATGACAADAALRDKRLGLLIDGGSLLKGQLVAMAVAWGVAIIGTFIILKVLDIFMGLRVSRAVEIEGLDVSEHGEEGYIFY